MNCDHCERPLLKKKATSSQPYLYTLAGLNNVFLSGIEVFYCSICKLESPTIPRIGELHREIARVIVKKSSLLNGDELRFIRKNAGFPAKSFAALLGVNPSHLSRVENGKTASLGKSSDSLARLFAAAAICGDNVKETLLNLGRKLAESHSKKGLKKKSVFVLKDRHWEKAA